MHQFSCQYVRHFPVIKPNGPAIKGGCVTWRSHPATSLGTQRERGQKIVPVARQVWRAFCHPGSNNIGSRCGRGTSLIDDRVFLPVENVGKRHWRSVAVQV